jgi:small subunit ribosomal protein S20e
VTNSSASFYSLLAPTETVKQIIINIEAGVEVEVTIAA